MREVGVRPSRLKPSLAMMGEKAGRLKPNGRLRGYSPLGRVIDLEVLILGVTGKLRLWTVLGELLDGKSASDLDGLILRAGEQRTLIEELQARAARLL